MKVIHASLWPGSISSAIALRKELSDQKQNVIFFGITSLAGGVTGALLLIRTPNDTFVKLLPFFMLFATLMFVYGNTLTKSLRERLTQSGKPSKVWLAGVLVLQYIIATYGGYFGGGLGILLLGTLSLMEMKDIHRMNGLKAVLAVLINGAAVVTFTIRNYISWQHALVMIAGAIIGGYVTVH
ncbi:MAG: sulfite exporter TauE/SafE family protein [Chloroflexi bacterium]|nr:sulfite exporter TauE/SafE family protein [Chloroflexota bacterium]